MRKGVTNRGERLPRVVRGVGCSSHQWGSRPPSPAASVGSGVTENWVAVGQGPIRELTQVSTSSRKGAGPRPSPGPGRGAQRGARSPNYGGANSHSAVSYCPRRNLVRATGTLIDLTGGDRRLCLPSGVINQAYDTKNRVVKA